MKNKLFKFAILLFALLLSACSLPTPTSMAPLSIAIHPNTATVHYGGCDPHVLQVNANLSGDIRTVTRLTMQWEFHRPDGSVTPGANGSGELPMTPSAPGIYTWNYDFGAGPGFPYQNFIINLNVKAYDNTGAVLSTASVNGLQWLSCTSLYAVPPVAHIVMTSTLTAGPNPLYYGSCNPHVLNIHMVLNGDSETLARVSSAEADVEWLNPDGSATADIVNGEQVHLTRNADGSYSGTEDWGTATRGTFTWTTPLELRVEGYAYDSSGARLIGSYRDSSTGNIISEASDIVTVPFLPCGGSGTGTGAAAVTPTDTAAATPTAQLAAEVIPTLNAFCRKGPGTLYDQVMVLQKGTAYNVIGRDSLNSWWQIQTTGSNACWVGDANVSKQGPVEQAAIVQGAPLPGTPGNFVSSFVCNLKSKTLGVSFNWAGEAGVSGYRIYQNGSLLTTVAGNLTTYHEAAPLGEDLVYELEAFNAYGVAARSSTNVPACK